MTREEAYRQLFIREQMGEDISGYLKKLVMSHKVPDDVREFLSASSQGKLGFVQDLKEKKFYKNLMDESLSSVEQAKALSSLVTHVLIEHGNTGEPIQELSEPLGLHEALEALADFLSGDDHKVREVCGTIRKTLR